MFDCPRQIKGIRRRAATGPRRTAVIRCGGGVWSLWSVSHAAPRAVRFWSVSKNRYRIGIVFNWQQKIGVSVSAENGVLGLTLETTVLNELIWSVSWLSCCSNRTSISVQYYKISIRFISHQPLDPYRKKQYNKAATRWTDNTARTETEPTCK